jgi:hypothetical protein
LATPINGHAADFARIVSIVDSFGPWCLIGGVAVNCYVEQVHTRDADIVAITSNLTPICERLRSADFQVEERRNCIDITSAHSDVLVQFTKYPQYQTFIGRSREQTVMGAPCRVACLEDVAQGKLWAYGHAARTAAKRKKDELDLVRLATVYPKLKTRYPSELRNLVDRA